MKIANEINKVSSVAQYTESQFIQLRCVLSPGLHFWSNPNYGQTLGATDFSCAVSGFGQSREVKHYRIE